MQVLISAERLHERVAELAEQLKRHYGNEPVTIVGVLTGCLIFLADLVRHLDLPLRIALIQASSYRGATTTAGALQVRAEHLPDLAGRHVLLVDDILDTGHTLAHVIKELHTCKPASLRSMVLLRKQGRQEADVQPDYFGFDIPNAFVVGYGLDYNDEYRNLPYVAVLSPLHIVESTGRG